MSGVRIGAVAEALGITKGKAHQLAKAGILPKLQAMIGKQAWFDLEECKRAYEASGGQVNSETGGGTTEETLKPGDVPAMFEAAIKKAGLAARKKYFATIHKYITVCQADPALADFELMLWRHLAKPALPQALPEDGVA